jgi:hypothetical protein
MTNPMGIAAASAPADLDGAEYAQPTPRLLYVHDDLTEEVASRFGATSNAATLARHLLDVLAEDSARVVVLSLAAQVERVIDQGVHAPFELAIAIGRAGQRVARALHTPTGWFPRVRRIGLAREEDGRGGYRLVSTDLVSVEAQLADLPPRGTLAVVDDTVFSGLTMRCVLEMLPGEVRARTHAFCLRGVAESIDAIRRLCPVTAGVAAPGRLLDEVSFINASGLVLRVGVRRHGQPPLAFFDRPAWIAAWFPGRAAEVLALCRRLNALLDAA